MLSSWLKNVGLFKKIGLIVTVPIAGLLIISADQIKEKIGVTTDMQRTAQLVALASDVSALAHSLQREAAGSAAFVSTGNTGGVKLEDLQHSSTDAARRVVETSQALNIGAASSELKSVLDDGLAKANGISAIRPQILSRAIAPAQMNGTFTGAIVRLLDFSSFAPGAINNVEVARAMQVYAYLLQAAEASSAARANAAVGFAAGTFDLPTYQTVLKFLSRQVDFVALINQIASPAEREFYASTYSGHPVDETARMVKVMADAGPGGGVSSVSQDAWLSANAERMKLFSDVEARFETDLRNITASVMDTAEHQLETTIIAVLVLLAVTGLIAFVIARSATRPINHLVASMKGLAAGDFSQAVGHIERGDEIGEMARSVLVFKENGAKLAASEREAADTRRLAEAQAVRNETDRVTAAAEQSRVVESIALGLQNLADGQLIFRISEPFPTIYEGLRADFNGAMEKLEEAMSLVARNAATIRSGTAEISSASDDLSRRTEQQAASLEETAAALDEITATVKKTSDGSIHARTVVSNTKADAERSGTVVGQAIEAMSAIEQSAQKVTQIIGVIDEIAFQTNLLALNAGVEAARAGEAGRGFAVVASEVRALAQRSAEAAKEIKALISTSSQQVSTGVDLVNETGDALKRIVSQVAEINAVVSDIATSTQEQATALQEVNTAINQMDQVTQQNAAMVEQSTAASKNLASETEELGRLVGQFQLAGHIGNDRPHGTRTKAKPSSRAMPALRTTGSGGAARKAEPAVQSWEEF